MFYMKKNDLNLFDEMSNLFGNSFLGRNGSLKTDIIENEKDYLVTMEVPGIAKENIKIDIEDEYLNVAITREENSECQAKYLRRERKCESISRSFYIGAVDKQNVKAKMENGVLNLTIPKVLPVVEEKKYVEIE